MSVPIEFSKEKLILSMDRTEWDFGKTEVFFQATKSRGFNMEESCLRCLEKYKKLFSIVSIAYTICWV